METLGKVWFQIKTHQFIQLILIQKASSMLSEIPRKEHNRSHERWHCHHVHFDSLTFTQPSIFYKLPSDYERTKGLTFPRIKILMGITSRPPRRSRVGDTGRNAAAANHPLLASLRRTAARAGRRKSARPARTAAAGRPSSPSHRGGRGCLGRRCRRPAAAPARMAGSGIPTAGSASGRGSGCTRCGAWRWRQPAVASRQARAVLGWGAAAGVRTASGRRGRAPMRRRVRGPWRVVRRGGEDSSGDAQAAGGRVRMGAAHTPGEAPQWEGSLLSSVQEMGKRRRKPRRICRQDDGNALGRRLLLGGVVMVSSRSGQLQGCVGYTVAAWPAAVLLR